MNPNNKMLIGTWISDPKDTESIRRFGNVKLHFTADGRLIYIIPGEEKDQKMFLTYRVENNILITDQPSVPREERANFRITTDGKQFGIKTIIDFSSHRYCPRKCKGNSLTGDRWIEKMDA